MTFLRECEIEQSLRVNQLLEYNEDGWTLPYSNLEACQADGYYGRVQTTDTQ